MRGPLGLVEGDGEYWLPPPLLLPPLPVEPLSWVGAGAGVRGAPGQVSPVPPPDPASASAPPPGRPASAPGPRWSPSAEPGSTNRPRAAPRPAGRTVRDVAAPLGVPETSTGRPRSRRPARGPDPARRRRPETPVPPARRMSDRWPAARP